MGVRRYKNSGGTPPKPQNTNKCDSHTSITTSKSDTSAAIRCEVTKHGLSIVWDNIPDVLIIRGVPISTLFERNGDER